MSDTIPHNRIVLRVFFGESLPTLAVVDTGAPYCILNPEEAEPLRLNFRLECERLSQRLNIRGDLVPGWICRIPIRIVAEEGTSLQVEASVFVPELAPGSQWRAPNFLGMTGFLDRIRFAVDPEHNRFYFGALGSA
jgi:hypothetical protein